MELYEVQEASTLSDAAINWGVTLMNINDPLFLKFVAYNMC